MTLSYNPQIDLGCFLHHRFQKCASCCSVETSSKADLRVYVHLLNLLIQGIVTPDNGLHTD